MEPSGSSPRVRGKPAENLVSPLMGRLIPACAGKTMPCRRTTFGSGAHPRVCGENKGTGPASQRALGSSPRVRGKQLAKALEPHAGRLIPACAGKTACKRHCRTRFKAHPRVCGENSTTQIQTHTDRGSSPRVRGKRTCRVPFVLGCGLIPACAGKTVGSGRYQVTGTAHPRVCGENSFQSALISQSSGSSPRVRGKRGQYP